MKIKRTIKLTTAVLAGGMVLGTGNCLPNDYWSGYIGEHLSAATLLLLEDFISDSVDAVDPALEVNQI